MLTDHFNQYMEAEGLAAAREVVRGVGDEYGRLHGAATPPEALALLDRIKGPPPLS